MLIGAGLALLTKAGAGIPGLVIAAFPAAIAVLVTTVLVRERRNGRAAAEPEVSAAAPAAAPDVPAESSNT